MERASRLMRVTTSVSPGWMKSRMVWQFGTVLKEDTAAGFGPDHGASHCLERGDLGIGVLATLGTLAQPMRAAERFILGVPLAVIVHCAGSDPE